MEHGRVLRQHRRNDQLVPDTFRYSPPILNIAFEPHCWGSQGESVPALPLIDEREGYSWLILGEARPSIWDPGIARGQFEDRSVVVVD